MRHALGACIKAHIWFHARLAVTHRDDVEKISTVQLATLDTVALWLDIAGKVQSTSLKAGGNPLTS